MLLLHDRCNDKDEIDMNIEKAKKIKAKMISELYNGLYYQYYSDNTILFTMEMYALFHELGIFDEVDADRLHKAIRNLGRRRSGGFGEDIIPGLYNRNPGRDDRKDQWDNYAAISFSVMFGKEFQRYPQEILQYGKKFWWYSYDNRAPMKFSVHKLFDPLPNLKYFECVRQGWHVFTYQVSADCVPNPLFYLWYVGKVSFENNDPNKTTGKLISWLRYKAIGHKWYMRPFRWMFNRKIKKLYGDKGITEAFRIYHGEDSDLYKLSLCLLGE